MEKKLKLPFEEEEKTQEKRRNLRFRTAYYDLLEIEHRINLQTDLNLLANNNNKYGMTEFTIASKMDGTPYILARYWNDLDLEDKNLNWFDINVRLFGHYQLEDLDEIVNKHDGKTFRLLGEKRFTYKTGEVVVIIIYSEIRQTARNQEALNAIRATLSR